MRENDWMEIVNESDRGCVLLATAMIESRLDEIFEAIFSNNMIPKKIINSLFDSNGPLATFSAKSKLAFSLGLISKNAFEDLEILRKIRNNFAHTADKVDFINHELTKEIEKMNCVKYAKDRAKNVKRYDISNTDFQKPQEGESEETEADIFRHINNHQQSGDALAIPIDATIRARGFVKYTTALLAIGMCNLEQDLLNYVK